MLDSQSCNPDVSTLTEIAAVKCKQKQILNYIILFQGSQKNLSP